jgi:hypothetical protein
MFLGSGHLCEDYGAMVSGRSRKRGSLVGISVREGDSKEGDQSPGEGIDLILGQGGRKFTLTQSGYI